METYCSPLDVCNPSPFVFAQCDTNHWKLTGTILTAGTVDFSGAINEPFWALGFSSLGNAYPNQTNIEQAYYFTSLQTFPSDLPQLSATEVQFNDEYQTPSGVVNTFWTIAFDSTNKKITVGNLMTQLPGQSPRACPEILLAFWRLDSFAFSVPPTTIILPYS
jgi:hypothetical protein